ncbi:MAG TPA: DUF6159 family protein [Dehalococcoidia bacterium]|nr:DUF6159 family protein [Dehalococcoidia bacterium]
MFRTIGNTFDLMRLSWRVLMGDKALLVFPVLSGLAGLAAITSGAGVLFAGHFFDRMDAGQTPTIFDLVLLFLFYILTSFGVIYFNAALVAAVYDRMQGGDGSVRYGLEIANERIGAIFWWSVIAATVAFILRVVISDRGVPGRIAASLLGAAWGFLTFFAVPALIIENVSPIEAIGRSSSLIGETWGKRIVGNFGFGLAYFAVLIVALVPAGIAFGLAGAALAIVLGLLVSLPLLLIGVAAIKAMEGIFNVALYNFACGGANRDFPAPMLKNAYVQKSDRGSWRGDPYLDRQQPAI